MHRDQIEQRAECGARTCLNVLDSEHLEAYISGELDEKGRAQVEHALRNDANLCASFVSQVQMNAALGALLGGAENRGAFTQGVLARLRSEGAGDRGFAKSVLLEIVEEREGKQPIRWPDLLKAGVISAAASVGLLLLFQSIVFNNGERSESGRRVTEATEGYAARIERSEGLVWDQASLERIRPDGWLSPGLLRLERGSAVIAFNSGATSVVEGPAELSIESGNRLFLKIGRLSAEVPPLASGFTVNTPRLNAVDIGTRFGVSVDGEGNSELHVMEGEVEVSRTSGNAVATRLREGLAVRADGRTRTELVPVPYGGDQFRLQVGAPEEMQPDLRFTFDESVGAILEDSGKSRLFDVPMVASGELDRSPKRAAGRFGGGLVFQPGETVDVPLSREFRLDEPHTISFWIKLPAKVGQSGQEVIFEYGREGLAWRVSCNLSASQGVRGALRVGCGESFVIGGTDLADGNWHHVAYRYLGEGDLASHLHLFVDGKPETLSASLRGAPSGGRAGNLRLGGAESEGFEGWIDNLSLYREAISTNALQALGE